MILFQDFLYNEDFYWTDSWKFDQWYRLIFSCNSGFVECREVFRGKSKEVDILVVIVETPGNS